MQTKKNMSFTRHKTRRKRARRKSKILSSSEVAHQKMLNRERVRRCRQKRKDEFIKRSCNSLDDVSRVYQIPQALGKAVGKVSSVASLTI